MSVTRLQRAFGKNFRSHRQQLGLSQERFAEMLGVHRTYLGGIERGERNLSLQSIEYYCSRLGLDPLTMLTPVEDEQAQPDPKL
ncbi:helix-turn-helix transcriptional regulator [Scrofimicrobium sp. R131]|uniref:Helix-turn-helix transcriptional regulator n=1 Tax=Scrofimicrobium appendicitidis TaxID=3079930 RepID=A0AAU7V8V6_9ACTO